MLRMPLDQPLKRSDRNRPMLDAADVHARRQRALLLLKRLRRSMQVEGSGGPLLPLYEQLVNGVWSSFDAEERLLRGIAHPRYADHSSAHRQIARGLAEARHLLQTRTPTCREELFHCLDALVIHLTIDGAVFDRLESDVAPSEPDHPQQLTDGGRPDLHQSTSGTPQNALSESSRTRMRVPPPCEDAISN